MPLVSSRLAVPTPEQPYNRLNSPHYTFNRFDGRTTEVDVAIGQGAAASYQYVYMAFLQPLPIIQPFLHVFGRCTTVLLLPVMF